MKVKNWLTINSRGSCKITKSKPNINLDEVSVLLDISIPDELFTKPRLEAKIDVPVEAANPEKIDANVIENVQEAIKSVTGLDFRVNLINEEQGVNEKDDENKNIQEF